MINFSVDNSGSKTLSIDIVENVMDELRRERKIAMVLADAEIEEYIKLDLSGNVTEHDEGISPFMKRTLIAKREFRDALCQKVSILRLGYMYKVLKTVHPGKAAMLGAESYKIKVIKLESQNNRRKKFAVTANAGSSAQVSGRQGGSIDSQALREQRSLEIVDPLLQNLNEFIEDLRKQISTVGQQKLKDFLCVQDLIMHKPDEPMDTVEENLKEIEK